MDESLNRGAEIVCSADNVSIPWRAPATLAGYTGRLTYLGIDRETVRHQLKTERFLIENIERLLGNGSNIGGFLQN